MIKSVELELVLTVIALNQNSCIHWEMSFPSDVMLFEAYKSPS